MIVKNVCVIALHKECLTFYLFPPIYHQISHVVLVVTWATVLAVSGMSSRGISGMQGMFRGYYAH